MVKEIRFGQKQICRAGSYTCTISLPKVWLENYGLVAGDKVNLLMDSEGSLTIHPAKKM